MNYESNYGAQRVILARLCKQTGVKTYDNGPGRKVQRPVQVLRAALFEKLRGPDWGYIEWSSAAEFDRMLTRAAATVQGDHGANLRLSQHHLRCGKEALAEATRLQSRKSKRTPAVEWKLHEVKVNFQKAKEYQDKHEGEHSNEQD